MKDHIQTPVTIALLLLIASFAVAGCAPRGKLENQLAELSNRYLELNNRNAVAAGYEPLIEASSALLTEKSYTDPLDLQNKNSIKFRSALLGAAAAWHAENPGASFGLYSVALMIDEQRALEELQKMVPPGTPLESYKNITIAAHSIKKLKIVKDPGNDPERTRTRNAILNAEAEESVDINKVAAESAADTHLTGEGANGRVEPGSTPTTKGMTRDRLAIFEIHLDAPGTQNDLQLISGKLLFALLGKVDQLNAMAGTITQGGRTIATVRWNCDEDNVNIDLFQAIGKWGEK